jgi:hypothetical protein
VFTIHCVFSYQAKLNGFLKIETGGLKNDKIWQGEQGDHQFK